TLQRRSVASVLACQRAFRLDASINLSLASNGYPALPLIPVRDPQEPCRLGMEPLQLHVILRGLLHPCDRLDEPLAGLVLLTHLPAGHGKEETVRSVAEVIRLAQADRLFQVRGGAAPVAGSITGGAESSCETGHVR